MDRCVLLTSSPKCVVSPRGETTHEGVGVYTHTYPWLIPIITWCRLFLSISTNILLIKSKLKLQSRAIAVGIAMSPRNLDDKYRYRPHTRSRKCTCQFFCGKQSVLIWLHQSGVIAWRQRRRSCRRRVFKVEYLWHTSNENDEFYTWYIPVLEQVGMSLMGSPTWGFSFCLSRSSLVFWGRDTPLAREFQIWGSHVNNGILIDFRAVKYVSVESGLLCRDNISWYFQFD